MDPLVPAEEGLVRRSIWESRFLEWERRSSENPTEVPVEEISEDHFPKECDELLEESSSDESDYVDDDGHDENVDDSPPVEVEEESEMESEEQCKDDIEEEPSGSSELPNFAISEEEDVEALFSENERLREIVRIIEIELQSNMKNLLYKTIESKVLRMPDFERWFQLARLEKRRLAARVPSSDVKLYVAFLKASCNLAEAVEAVRRVAGGRLRALLELREAGRLPDGAACALHAEWRRLRGRVPARYLLMYASAVVQYAQLKGADGGSR